MQWWDGGDGYATATVEITDVSIDDAETAGAEAAAEAGDGATIEQVVATYNATERGVAVERTIALEGIEVTSSRVHGRSDRARGRAPRGGAGGV